MKHDENHIKICKYCGGEFDGNFILVGLSIACPYCKKVQG